MLNAFSFSRSLILILLIGVFSYCHKPRDGKYRIELEYAQSSAAYRVKIFCKGNEIKIKENTKTPHSKLISEPKCSGSLTKNKTTVGGRITITEYSLMSGSKDHSVILEGEIEKLNFNSYTISGKFYDPLNNTYLGTFYMHPLNDWIK